MQHTHSLASPIAPIRPVLAGAALSLVLGTLPAAQSVPRFVVSTTADVPAGAWGFDIDDAALVAAGGGASARPQLFAEHWLAVAGFAPSDVDAFARIDSVPPGNQRSFVFSLLANEGGALDGDVLVLTPGGGVQPLFPEDLLTAGLGVPGASIDVDALDFDSQGRLLFSLQSDLDGTTHGTVEDGDVLRLEPNGNVSLVLREPEVQAKFSAATGLSSSIGDVQGIECVGGELWVAIQAPSSHDGAVLACGPVPSIVIDEAAMGLDGAELDALSVANPGEELVCMTSSVAQAAPGDLVHLAFHGEPFGVYLVLKAGGAGYWPYPQLGGFQAFYLDPSDPWLNAVVAAPNDSVVVLGPTGFFEWDFPIPTAPLFGAGFAGGEGWSMQLLGASGEVSVPVRIAKL